MTDNTPSEAAKALAHRIVCEFRPGGWPAKEIEIAHLIDRHLPAAEPVAWMRRWAFDKNEGTKGNRPKGWLMQATSEAKIFADDVALYATTPATVNSDAGLVEAVERVLKWVEPITGDNHSDAAAAEELASVEALRAALTRAKGDGA